MRECKKILQANGWTDGYNMPEGNVNGYRKLVIDLAKKEGFYSKDIGHHFPNNGTFTYDDGIIDFVLGAINPMSEVALMAMDIPGASFVLTY